MVSAQSLGSGPLARSKSISVHIDVGVYVLPIPNAAYDSKTKSICQCRSPFDITKNTGKCSCLAALMRLVVLHAQLKFGLYNIMGSASSCTCKGCIKGLKTDTSQ